MARFGRREGSIKRIESELIHGAFRFGESRVKDILVPMDRVFHMGVGISAERAARTVSRRGSTRVPVTDRGGRVVGIMYAKDLIGHVSGRAGDLAREAFTTRPDERIAGLFEAMKKKKRIHMAAVVDGRGHPNGIVTLEDILEELVGEIFDEYPFKKGFGGPKGAGLPPGK